MPRTTVQPNPIPPKRSRAKGGKDGDDGKENISETRNVASTSKRGDPKLEGISQKVPPVFMQSQQTVANHRKNAVNLHKIQTQAAAINEEVPGRGIKLTGEKAFNDVFMDMVNRVLPLKKGIVQADKVVKFVGTFVKYTTDKAADTKLKAGAEVSDDDDEESHVSRFVNTLVKHLLKGFEAKDKNVRYRTAQFIAEIISCIGEIDEDVYTALRDAVLGRIRDKEAPVRLQAVVALAKLQKGEEGQELDEDQEDLLEILVKLLQYDPAPEVRRAALLNIAPSQTTIPIILSRTRDQDNIMRKIVYRHVLASLPSPLLLTIAQREQVVRNGLGDRDPAVRAAAGGVIGKWVDAVEGLENFLKMLDVFTSDVAEDALLSVFVTRLDIFDSVEFDEELWSNLNPERAFLVRVFVDHCLATKNDDRLENTLPVVTALAFRIQNEYNELIDLVKSQHPARDTEEDEIDDEDENEMRRSDKGFVIAELLKLAVNLDYSDEIGRRKMFALVRDMLTQEFLPEGLVARCLDILRKLSASERDLILVVVEVVQELRDFGRDVEDDEPTRGDDETQFGDDDRTVASGRRRAAAPPEEEMDEETRERMEYIELRCLILCIGMLERVNGTLQENSSFHGLLHELIIPSVRCKKPLQRERGLAALGLCCLIDPKMALSSIQLFVHQSQTAHEDLRAKMLQVVFDLVMVHEAQLLKNPAGPGERRIVEFISRALEEDNPVVQAVTVEGIAKLMLSGMISDEDVLSRLVLVYLSPETADNQPLRQCLSYFFPVYCYSSPVNQRRMQRIFLPTLNVLSGVYKDLDNDQEMVPPSQVGLLLVDWTDPQKAVEVKGHDVDETIHVDVAIDMLKALFDEEMDKEDKKTLCQLLGKLYVPNEVGQDTVRTLQILLSNLQRRCPLPDATTRNAVKRFETNIAKKFSAHLEDFNEQELQETDAFRELFEWMDLNVPGDDTEATPVKKAAKARAVKPAKGKKAKTEESDDEDGEEGEGEEEGQDDQSQVEDETEEEVSVDGHEEEGGHGEEAAVESVLLDDDDDDDEE